MVLHWANVARLLLHCKCEAIENSPGLRQQRKALCPKSANPAGCYKYARPFLEVQRTCENPRTKNQLQTINSIQLQGMQMLDDVCSFVAMSQNCNLSGAPLQPPIEPQVSHGQSQGSAVSTQEESDMGTSQHGYA